AGAIGGRLRADEVVGGGAEGLGEGVVVSPPQGDPAVARAVGSAAQGGDQMVREERAVDVLRLEGRLLLGAGGEERFAGAGEVVGQVDVEWRRQVAGLLAQESAAL